MFKIKEEQPKKENVIWSIVNRVMNDALFAHAKTCGATDEWIDSIRHMHPMTIYQVITILYGEPTVFQTWDKKVSEKIAEDIIGVQPLSGPPEQIKLLRERYSLDTAVRENFIDTAESKESVLRFAEMINPEKSKRQAMADLLEETKRELSEKNKD